MNEPIRRLSVVALVMFLILMIAASVAGAWIGAPIVARWPRRNVQVGLGFALLLLAGILIYRQFGDPTGGDRLGLTGVE